MNSRTRAQEIGVSSKVLRNASLRKLATMKKLAESLAYHWGDIDNTVVMDAQELIKHFAEVEKTITAATAYLNEVAP